jgi:hypothetical protein
MQIDAILKRAVTNQLKKKIEAGHNGPYHDEETLVRNSSHWLMLYLNEYKLRPRQELFNKINKLISYLTSEKARPQKWTWHHRNKKGKDKCNGLIGPAWTIEALLTAGQVLKRPDLIELCQEVFLAHPFSTRLGLWKRREITGNILRYDLTYNHQLWFLAIGSLISTDSKHQVGKQVHKAMDLLGRNTSIHSNGLIKHLSFSSVTRALYLVKNALTRSPINRKYLYKKEVGYHSFSCYALALLHHQLPDHAFWKTKKFRKIQSFALSEEHLRIGMTNKYGSQYNPVGIELAFFEQEFQFGTRRAREVVEEGLKKQFEQHLDNKTGQLSKNTADSITLSARLYEATRLSKKGIFNT